MPFIVALLLLFGSTLSVLAHELVTVTSEPAKALLAGQGSSTLSLAGQADDQCMLEAAYVDGPLVRKPAPEKLTQWVTQCVRFDRGVGAWYLDTSASRGQPVDPESEAAAETLRGFQRGSRLWLTLAVKKCATAAAPTAQACQALMRPQQKS